MGGLCLYPDFEALGSRSPSSTIGENVAATRLGVFGDEAYCAWHSTNVVDVVSMIDGSLIRTIPLEDYDTWVWGVSVAGGRLFLIDDGRGDYPDEGRGVHIVSFDPVTGERRGDVTIDVFPDQFMIWPSGLWCESPRPELP
jgi:hypothetical protein